MTKRASRPSRNVEHVEISNAQSEIRPPRSKPNRHGSDAGGGFKVFRLVRMRGSLKQESDVSLR